MFSVAGERLADLLKYSALSLLPVRGFIDGLHLAHVFLLGGKGHLNASGTVGNSPKPYGNILDELITHRRVTFYVS